jgi:hypothetical protein
MIPSSPHPRRRRSLARAERGWALASALVLTALVTAVVVSLARHAVLMRHDLAEGFVDDPAALASHSGLDRLRERMRLGLLDSSTPADQVLAGSGHEVLAQHTVLDHQRRQLSARAQGTGPNADDDVLLLARASIVPADGTRLMPTTLDCAVGHALLTSATIVSIDGDQLLEGVDLDQVLLLEPGAVLTLRDVVLRGAILTQPGLCADTPLSEGHQRPRLVIEGGLGLRPGASLPDVAIVGPDLVVEADGWSRVQLDGFICADELRLLGRGRVSGMIVTTSSKLLGADLRQPGAGRGPQSWPAAVTPGAERITRLAVPEPPLTDVALARMLGVTIP